MTKTVSFHLLLVWHGLLAGAYTIAWLTAEEGRALHHFAGYLVLVLLALRLSAAAAASDRSAWALPWPQRSLWQSFVRKVRSGDRAVLLQRTPLTPLSGLVILATLVLVGLSGLTAGWWNREGLHEAVAEGSPFVVLFHIALVSLAPMLKKMSGSNTVSGTMAPLHGAAARER